MAVKWWREKRDSNPQPTVLETGALPIELFSQRNQYNNEIRQSRKYFLHQLFCRPHG